MNTAQRIANRTAYVAVPSNNGRKVVVVTYGPTPHASQNGLPIALNCSPANFVCSLVNCGGRIIRWSFPPA